MKRFIDNMMKQVLKKNASNSGSTTVTIPDRSITTSKLAKNSVCELDLIDGVVTTNKLGNKNATDKKITDGTITLANLSAEVKSKLNS